MSTNYYVRTAQTPPDAEGIHLGKWANGEFHFRAYPAGKPRPAEITWDVTDYGSWSRLLDLGDVTTEAGRPVTSAEMVSEVQREPRHWRPAISRDQFTDERGNRFSPYEFC
jgi:hypothetical protein